MQDKDDSKGHDAKSSDDSFERTFFKNPWSEAFKSMSQPTFENWQEFSGKIVKGLMDFYAQSMEFNPLLKPAIESLKQNSDLLDQMCSPEQSKIMTEINVVMAQMMQILIQKQQQYLGKLFEKLGSQSINDMSNMISFSQEYFSDISNVILETSEKINDLLFCYCENLHAPSNSSNFAEDSASEQSWKDNLWEKFCQEDGRESE